jgi:hypothetical protein
MNGASASGGGRNAAKNWNTGFAQDVLDDRFPQPRRVVFEMQVIGFFVEAKALQAISVGKISESAKLLRFQRLLELVGYGHECHARDYNIPRTPHSQPGVP